LALLAYALILTLPLPPDIGLALRYHPAIALTVVVLTLYPVYKHRHGLSGAVSFGFTLLLVALPLSGLWNSGASEYPVLMGGLFPFTDGDNYYEDAQRLLRGVRFDAVSSGRPLFAALLGVLLAFTQQNLQIALAVLAAIGAIACFVFSREVQRTTGTEAGLLVMVVLFLFYRRFIGAAWTEHAGLAWGAIALTLMGRSVTERSGRGRLGWGESPQIPPHQGHVFEFLSGLFFLSLAMNARSGAVFSLPLLMVWGGWVFRPPATQFSWWVTGSGLGAIALGFALNYWVLATVGRPDVGFSNLSYNLYSQVVGSHDWRQVRLDYPEVLTLDQPEVTYRIYELAWVEFLRDPLRLLGSSIEAIATYLSPTADGVFGFVSTYGLTTPALAITGALYLLSLLGLLHCLRRWRDPRFSLLLVYLLGIIVSLPLAPPWIDGVPSSMRVYAATLPVVALLPAVGFARLLASYFPPPRSLPRISVMDWGLPYAIGIGLGVLSILAPIAIASWSQIPTLPTPVCAPGTETAVIHYSPGAALHLVADDALPHTHLPQVRLSDFRTGVETVTGFLARRQSRITEEIREVSRVTGDRTLLHPLNLQTHSALWVVAPSREMPPHTALLALCGTVNHQVFYVLRIMN